MYSANGDSANWEGSVKQTGVDHRNNVEAAKEVEGTPRGEEGES